MEIKISAYRYIIEFIPGDANVWADLLTRWAAPIEKKVNRPKLSLLYAPIDMRKDEFKWPTRTCLEKSQRKTKQGHTDSFSTKSGLVQNNKGVIFIPKDDEHIELRITTASHTGWEGNLKSTETLAEIQKRFWRENMKEDVKSFCNSCFHCLVSDSGERIQRPLGHSMHAEKPNELIHFDFCFMEKSKRHPQYVLVVKDDLSSYCWLYVCDNADSNTVVEALINWFATSGVSWKWIYDQGTYFKNQVMIDLCKKLHTVLKLRC